MDVYSRYPYCDLVASKDSDVVKEAYLDMISLLGEPDVLVYDGRPEFSEIKDLLQEKQKDNPSPAYHPQANGILERWHKELGKMCRIHNCSPPQAVKYLRTPQQKLMFYSQLKLKYLDASINVLEYKVR